MIKSGTDLISEAKSRVKQVSAHDALAKHGGAGRTVFLDVREPNEWNLGRIPGALHIPRGMLETKIEQAVPRDASVIIYCASGNRSALAADTMQQMGYQDVASLAGGWRDWVGAGGQVEG